MKTTMSKLIIFNSIGPARLNKKKHKTIDTKTNHKRRALNANIYAPLIEFLGGFFLRVVENKINHFVCLLINQNLQVSQLDLDIKDT